MTELKSASKWEESQGQNLKEYQLFRLSKGREAHKARWEESRQEENSITEPGEDYF